MVLFLTTNMGTVTSHANQQYGCCTWVPQIQQNIKDIESVQRRAAHFCEKMNLKVLIPKNHSNFEGQIRQKLDKSCCVYVFFDLHLFRFLPEICFP